MNSARTLPLMLAAALAFGPGTVVAESAGTAAAQARNIGTGPSSFVRTTRMIGREIVDSSGEVFGEVEDYVVDDEGQAFAIIAMGGFLGLAESEVLVPHAAISLSPTAPELLVYLGDSADLEKAPVFRPQRDALRATAKERKLLLDLREESKDVSEAERTVQDARARLEQERKELRAAEKARHRAAAKN